MAQVITLAGEKLFATKAQANQQLDIDTFIFANVAGQDPAAAIDRNEGIPTNAIVHQQNVQQTGRINDNVVVYSTVLDSVTGPFEFNWVGLYSSVNQTLVAISHVPTVSKTITAPGSAGNTLNRNFGIEYSGIADLAGISVSPETWQLDFTARLSGMDELTRQLASDMNGKDWFIDDGFKVVPRSTANTFSVTPGVGYVSGLRVELKQEHILTLQTYPQFVYVDAYFDGNASSQWKPQVDFTVTSGEMDDYIDVNGVQHYMNKIAYVIGTNAVNDKRNNSEITRRVEKLEELNKDFKNVDEMLSYDRHEIGNTYSTGGTIWHCSNIGDKNVGSGLYVSAITPINILDYGVPVNGENGDVQLAKCINENPLKDLIMPPSDGYNFTKVPAGIDSVNILASQKQRRLGGSGKTIPVVGNIFSGNKEVAIVSCCIRWYDSTTVPKAPGDDGWYTLFDGGEEHDPILMGPVIASGQGSLIISVNLGDFGLNSNAWTPSGFIVSPDETLAASGVSFGASVSSNQVTITGTYNSAQAAYISYNGEEWTFSGVEYDNPTYNNGVLSLTRKQNSTKGAANFPAQISPIMRRQTAADWGANKVDVSVYGGTSDKVSLIFTDINGDRVMTPDTRLKFYLGDSKLRNPQFNFGANPGGGTNIWMMGAFVKRESFD